MYLEKNETTIRVSDRHILSRLAFSSLDLLFHFSTRLLSNGHASSFPVHFQHLL